MSPLYNIGIHAYSAAARIAALRSEKIGKMISGQKHTLATLGDIRAKVAPDGFDVWIHAASLGEFEQARPMIERLRRERPHLTILLSFFSPSGFEVRKNYDKVDAVVYLPFDTPANVSSFLEMARPHMAIFVKYEFWGNYLCQLKKRGIPTYIISAIFRPEQVFFKWYGQTFRNILGCFDHIFLQDDNSKRLLSTIGIENVTVAGDTRFDRVTDVMRSTVHFPMIERWATEAKAAATGAISMIIAGSSWEPDEDYYIPYLNSHPGIRAIIAPHEFDAARLSRIQERISGKSVLFSQVEASRSLPSDVQVVIVDSFGKLSSLYRYGDLAIIGGGFGVSIHNINEAAVYSMPVIFGPKHQKFKEAADLIACGGGFEYTGADTLAAILDRLSHPEALSQSGSAAGDYIRHNLGATDLIYDYIFNKHS